MLREFCPKKKSSLAGSARAARVGFGRAGSRAARCEKRVIMFGCCSRRAGANESGRAHATDAAGRAPPAPPPPLGVPRPMGVRMLYLPGIGILNIPKFNTWLP